MALITLQNIHLSYGNPPLLDDINLQIEPGERLCLVGRNGAGKSTLMKLLRGELESDGGKIIREPGLRVAYLGQDVPSDLTGTIDDVVRGELPGKNSAAEERQASAIISRMKLDGATRFEELSAGMKRRVLLARGLATEPQLLLLDEPTNHLDLDAIQWLEEFLLRFNGTLLFVTHDRTFLQKLATRIVELDRGELSSWNCDYHTYLERKAAALQAEESQAAKFDKKLAAEEAWIRQGIKARRTRNEGRVRALKRMRSERNERRTLDGKVRFQLQEAERSGAMVVETHHLFCGYGETTLVKDFSTIIMRGDKIGILGPNGVGKTTLLKTLLGELRPQKGKVKQGTNLEVIYFDQLRGQLDENRTLFDNIGEGRDKVTVGGKTRHIIGYLQDFLFTPDRARSPVKMLSGGERNRLLIAKLFTTPANVIVMDEPTNDLDLETMELLEELLVDYGGTLLLISHDRAFVNNVVTSTIVFEGDGRLGEYVGGYDDWLEQSSVAKHKSATINSDAKDESKNNREQGTISSSKRGRKLSNKERQELADLPVRIESLEQKKVELEEKLAAPETYQAGADAVAQARTEFEQVESDLEQAFLRWEELDDIRK